MVGISRIVAIVGAPVLVVRPMAVFAPVIHIRVLNVAAASSLCNDARVVGALDRNAPISVQPVMDIHYTITDVHVGPTYHSRTCELLAAIGCPGRPSFTAGLGRPPLASRWSSCSRGPSPLPPAPLDRLWLDLPGPCPRRLQLDRGPGHPWSGRRRLRRSWLGRDLGHS